MNDSQDHLQNRSFLYGDGFFETIRVIEGHFPLISFHLERARRTAGFFQMDWNDSWTSDFFKQSIDEKKLYNGLLRATFYRGDGGTYVPAENNIHISILVRNDTRINGLFFTEPSTEEILIEKLEALPVIKVGLYHKLTKPHSSLSSFKSTSSILYVLAGNYLKQSNYEDLILLNDSKRLCEGLTSNLLLLNKGNWLTPSEDEGPVAGTFLAFLRTFLPIVDAQISTSEMEASEMCFLVNASHGLRRVSLNNPGNQFLQKS
jgi:branched-chain amino acid aminotransferase